MSKRNQTRSACVRVFVCALAVGLTFVASTLFGSRVSSSRSKRWAQGGSTQRVDIPLRSLTTRARGKLTIESSEGGGRARLTAMNLPDPQTVAAGATTYVVWAVSGGRIIRLGELRRDARGNGGLAFERPEGLERYGVIVTAESGAYAPRPSDPVLTTRADEAAALYPTKRESAAGEDSNSEAGTNRAAAPSPNGHTKPDAAKPPVPDLNSNRRERRAAVGDFYSEVDDALVSSGGGRVIELAGNSTAPQASGAARATLRRGSAYVRANFRGVPLPPALGANVYVLWGVFPDGRIVYMGSLPSDEAINTAEIYVRVAGFDSDDYTLFVTAEQQRPAPSPSPRRLLTPRNAGYVVK